MSNKLKQALDSTQGAAGVQRAMVEYYQNTPGAVIIHDIIETVRELEADTVEDGSLVKLVKETHQLVQEIRNCVVPPDELQTWTAIAGGEAKPLSNDQQMHAWETVYALCVQLGMIQWIGKHMDSYNGEQMVCEFIRHLAGRLPAKASTDIVDIGAPI